MKQVASTRCTLKSTQPRETHQGFSTERRHVLLRHGGSTLKVNLDVGVPLFRYVAGE